MRGTTHVVPINSSSLEGSHMSSSPNAEIAGDRSSQQYHEDVIISTE